MEKHITHLFGHIADFALILLAGSFVYSGLQFKQAKALRKVFTVFDWILSFGIAGFTGVMAVIGAYTLGVTNEVALLWILGAGAVMGLKSFNMMFDAMAEQILKMRKK